MQTVYKSNIQTPLGAFSALANDRGLIALEFHSQKRKDLLQQRFSNYLGNYRFEEDENTPLVQTREWVENYFALNFDDLEIPELIWLATAFEQRVWQMLLQIPLGTTLSYKEISVQLGIPNGARAVGGAVRRNPIALIVPCHRVIGNDGSLVGYGGGLEAKTFLLKHEQKALSGTSPATE